MSSNMQNLSLLTALLMLLVVNNSSATELKLESRVEAVPVLELFTSHGCSSCPPADRWLRKLTNKDGLWKDFIPMAFHVDYWDYLGWKDKFAKPDYSDRQRKYRTTGRVRSVYTPGFVVSGREWRGFFRSKTPNLNHGEKRGKLIATISPGKPVIASFMPEPSYRTAKLKAHVAVLGFGINSDIGGGENSGRNLKEDFVVLGDSSTRSVSNQSWNIPWPKTVNTKTSRQAVVVWLSREGDPAPVQAVASWIN